jgi:hypothetical protein
VLTLAFGTSVVLAPLGQNHCLRNDGNLGEYIGVSALKPFVDKDLILGESREFSVPGTQFRGRGITAEHFIDICRGYVVAMQAGVLHTDRQREIAIK